MSNEMHGANMPDPHNIRDKVKETRSAYTYRTRSTYSKVTYFIVSIWWAQTMANELLPPLLLLRLLLLRSLHAAATSRRVI